MKIADWFLFWISKKFQFFFLNFRPLLGANFSDKLQNVFLLHIMSVPAVILHLSLTAPECLELLITHRVFKRCLELRMSEQSTRIIFNTLEGNYCLCLMGKNILWLDMTKLVLLSYLIKETLFILSVSMFCSGCFDIWRKGKAQLM